MPDAATGIQSHGASSERTLLTELLNHAVLLRSAIEPGLDGYEYGHPIAAGACLYASVLVAFSLRRFFPGSAVVRGGAGHGGCGINDPWGGCHGHYWVEYHASAGAAFVVDITADQFGHPPVLVLEERDAACVYRPGRQDEVDLAVSWLEEDLDLGHEVAASHR